MDAEIATRVVDLAVQVGPRCGDLILIAIDGRSGAGKTTLASTVAGLVNSHGMSCTVIHVDELCPGWDGLPAVPGRLAALVADLAQYGHATYPTWDWYASGPGPGAEIPRSDVVIIEGAAASDPQWSDRTSVTIWVEAPAEARKQRAIARDGDSFAAHWDQWAAAEDAYFSTRPHHDADVVLEAD